MDEVLFGLFLFGRRVVAPFREMCVHLVTQLHQTRDRGQAESSAHRLCIPT